MKALKIKVADLISLKETYFRNDNFSEITIPLSNKQEIMQFNLKEIVAIVISFFNSTNLFELKGEIIWKRLNQINIPGKKLPSGIGIKLDEISMEHIKQYFPQELDFEDDEDEMFGGNYIKIRKNYIKKEIFEKQTQLPDIEQRKQPRIRLSIPLKLFIKDELFHNKSFDMSIEGMAIESKIMPKIGSELLIIFEDENTSKTFLLKSKIVRHLKYDKFSGIAVKFIFDNKNQQKDLMRFIAKNS